MSTGWRDAILSEFPAGLAPLSLVADPDNLLADELILAELQHRGLAVEVYEDPVYFRYVYESTYRPSLATAPHQTADLIVLLRGEREALEDLPYDLVQRGRLLDFSLAKLFPDLSRNVVAELDKQALDKLYQALQAQKPATLGENATKDFILHHVYAISPELIKSDADLLGMLLALHVSGYHLPPALAERVASQVNSQTGFNDWPLFELLTDSGALLSFLQERWPIFLDRLAAEAAGRVGEPHVEDESSGKRYNLRWGGQARLPFDAPHIWAMIDTLFLEGQLRPISHEQADALRATRVKVGLQEETDDERRARLEERITRLARDIPPADALHEAWVDFAQRWAEVIVVHQRLGLGSSQTAAVYNEAQTQIDQAFQAWLGNRYNNLATLSPHPPVMVHHIARSLAREIRADKQAKVALVVVDGLALDQWAVVRDKLQEQLPDLQMSESAVAAWIPTITAVSRQAIFAGDVPAVGFADSIGSTEKEPALWAAFWNRMGLDARAVGFAKGLRDSADMARVKALVTQPRMRVVGLVVNSVDEIMHGMKLGTQGLHEQLRLWLDKDFLGALLMLLTESGYRIVLTSDHGNIEARPIGSLGEGSLATSRGSRAHIYEDDALRTAAQQKKAPGAIAWSSGGLPKDYRPLLAPGRGAFVPGGQTVVTHGGITLEEVLVPYIQFQERQEA